jgi:competence protein ComEC
LIKNSYLSTLGLKKKTIFWLLVVANILAWLVVFDLTKPKPFEICFFNVGQGDSIFIETQKRQQILIDGGPNKIILKKLSQRMPFWDRSIDLMILTHPEKDHLFGLIEVLKRYKVENILWTGVKKESLVFQEWQEGLKKEKAKVRIAKKGLRVKFFQNYWLEILYPLEDLEGKEIKETNDTSIVSQLNLGGQKILLTGDISKKVEDQLVEEGLNLKSDVLKIAHHGSKYSSSDRFLAAILPQIAVISSGKRNPYHHPSPQVLERLENYGIKVLKTSDFGDICLIQKKKKQFLLLNPTE